jgi:hypothetical protein
LGFSTPYRSGRRIIRPGGALKTFMKVNSTSKESAFYQPDFAFRHLP